MKNKIIVSAMLLLSLFLVSCKGEKKTVEKKKAIPVSVYTVKKVSFVLAEERDGEILPYNRVYLVPTVQGTVIEMRKKIGDKVKKGEIVAVIDHRVIDDKLKSLRSNIEALKAKRLLLEKDVNRFKRLYEKDAVSKHKYEEINTEYQAVLNNEKALESQFNALKERLRDYFVKSPINGVVSDKLYDTGNVAAGKPLYVIDDLSRVKIVSGAGEDLFGKLGDGSYMEISVPSLNLKFKAPIQRLSSSVDYLTRTGKIESIVENKDGKLVPGMYIKVKVVAGEYYADAVLRDALMRLPGTGVYYVFKVNGDLTVSKVNLELGRINGNYQEILKGLAEGDKVVVKGQGILKSVDKVEVKEIEKL